MTTRAYLAEQDDETQIEELKKLIRNSIPYGIKLENVLIALAQVSVMIVELVKEQNLPKWDEDEDWEKPGA